MPITVRVNFTLTQETVNPAVSNFRPNWYSVQAAQYQTQPPDALMQWTAVQRVEYQEVLPKLRVFDTITQYIQRAPYEAMSNDVYPELIGLTYTTSAKPMFSTDVQTHTSGKETRTQYWENAKWDFTLQYDYLPNKSPSAQTDFKRLAGFFQSRAGSFDTFLFSAPDDHHVENQQLGVGDGNTVEYPLYRPMGDFNEPIGQIDPESAVVYLDTLAEHHTIPGSPYQFTLNHTNVVAVIEVKEGSTIYSRVDAAPGNHQYTFDPMTAKLTFWSGNAGANMTVRYKWIGVLALDYSFLFPRTLVMATAPATGDILSITFDFFFVVRFLEDAVEFDQFMDKLWELGKVEFRSQIQ